MLRDWGRLQFRFLLLLREKSSDGKAGLCRPVQACAEGQWCWPGPVVDAAWQG